MGFDRPGITPKKVVRKAKPVALGIAAGASKGTVRVPAAKPGDAAKRLRRQVAKANAKPRKPMDTGNILKGTSPPKLTEHALAEAQFHKALKNEPQPALAAPVAKVLNETLRPVRAISGGVDAALQGKNVLKAAGKGLIANKGPLFGDTLRHAGVPKGIAGVAGAALDIGLDPTTYATFGTGAVAKAGLKAEAAGKQAAVKGLTVKVAGREVPGIRKATAKVAGRPAQKVAQSKVGRGVRALGRDVNPNIAPLGVSPETWQHATSAARSTRAQTTRKAQEFQRRGAAVRKALGTNDMKVTHAIETGTIHTLPAHLQAPAKALADHYTQIRALEHQHGIPGGTRTNYVPHYTVQSLEAGVPGEVRGAVGKRVIRPDTSKSRTREGTLLEKVAAYPGEYNTDAALAYVNRMTKGHRDVHQARLNQRLIDLGRPVHPGSAFVEPGVGEQVFRQHGSDLTAVTDKQQLARIAAGKAPVGRYAVLHTDVVRHAHAISNPGGARSAIGAAYDKATGGFKSVAVASPAFHVRNYIGDVSNAYLGQPAYKLPGNIVQSAKTLKALGRAEKTQRTLGATAKPVKGSVRIGGQAVSYHDLAVEAGKVGAIRSGYTARELHDLMTTEAKGARNVRKTRAGQRLQAAGQNIKRSMQAREDNPRLATYIEARKRGMDPEAAARVVAHLHFDYANLTEFERKYGRRAMPFYTFTARNIPLQITSLLKQPGKFANLEKIRQEAATAAGLQPGWQDGLTDYQQRNMPVPVKWKGHTLVLTVGGLPATDLNEFPAALDPVKTASEWLSRGASMVNPILKDPAELWANYSTFFRDQIRKPNMPLVSAPSFVRGFPDALKRRLHVVERVDKQTGKKVLKWDAKADYIAHAFAPGLGTALMGLTAGPDRQGKGLGAKAISLTGVKPAPYDPTSTQIQKAYDRIGKIQGELGYLQKRGMDPKDDEARNKLNLEARLLQQKVRALASKRGDRILPGSRTVRKATTNDLSGVDLTGLDLGGASTGGVDISGLDLSGVAAP